MTGFNKTKLALATAGALLTASVSALDADFAATEPAFASNLLGLATAEVSNTAAFNIDTEITDLIIGRTTGFGIRVTLTGANFGAGAATTIGASISGGALPGGAAADWSIASETIAANVATITVSPGTTPAGLPVGTLLSFAAGDFDVTAVNGSLGAGVPVNALIEVFDPVTATVLLTENTTVYTSVEGTDTTIAGGDLVSRIDVGGENTPSKTDFATDGLINSGSVSAVFHAGTITVGLADTDAVTPGIQPASAAGTAYADYNNAGLFQFDADGDDTVEVTVSGTDFSAFDLVWLESDPAPAAACSTGSADGAVDGVGSDATGTGIDAAGTVLVADIDAAVTGETFNVCISTDGTTLIDDQDLDVATAIDLDPTPEYAAGALVDPAGDTGAITPLQFNGDVIEVHFFNDNQNVGQESRIRVSNKGNTAGLVRIVGTDDAGVDSAEATITLGADESVQLKSSDLINGTGVVTGAMGLPTQGKWRLTVTAEYDGLEVTNFVRNIESGILTNFTPSKEAQ